MIGDGGIRMTTGLEVIQAVEKLIPTVDARKRVEPKGVIQPDDLHIFLEERILREVVEWSKSDLDRELGGVFVGELFSHKGMEYLEIEGYIRARHYLNTAASFRFTHDTWSAISREREIKYGNKVVVGWHHTHPGYGVFLSGTDLFSHRSFFNLSWMFAMVVDPRAETLGFFQWKKGQVAPCGFFFVR
jgi:proteasome lid subunit RPN8/RPN11